MIRVPVPRLLLGEIEVALDAIAAAAVLGVVEFDLDIETHPRPSMLLGVAISVVGTRMVQGLLFETDPLDPVAFLGATAFLGTIGLFACILPAWRATRINPVEVLRKE